MHHFQTLIVSSIVLVTSTQSGPTQIVQFLEDTLADKKRWEARQGALFAFEIGDADTI